MSQIRVADTMLERVEGDKTPLLLAVGLGGLLALFLAIQPPVDVGLAALAAGVALLALFNRRVALYLIIPALTLSPDIPVAGVPVRVDDLLIVPLAAGWLARLCILKERQKTPIDRILIAYLLVALAATFWGAHLGSVHFSATEKDISAPFHVLKRLEFVLLFLILADTITTAVEVRSLTYTLMASMFALSAYALVQFLANQYAAVAPAGAPGHESGLASLLNIMLGISLLPTAKRPAKVLLGLIILFSLAVLPLSLGRNFLAATLLVLLYVGLFQQRWVLALFPILVAGALLLYPSHILGRVETFSHLFAPTVTPGVEQQQGTWEQQNASLLYRIQAPGYYALFALGYSPVVGFGLGSVPPGFIDSEYVIQLFYTGLVGGAIFVVFGLRLIDLVRQTRRLVQDPGQASLVRGFQLVLAGYAIFSIFNASVSATRTGGPFFVIVGLIAVLHRWVTQPAPAAPRSPIEFLHLVTGLGTGRHGLTAEASGYGR